MVNKSEDKLLTSEVLSTENTSGRGTASKTRSVLSDKPAAPSVKSITGVTQRNKWNLSLTSDTSFI